MNEKFEDRLWDALKHEAERPGHELPAFGDARGTAATVALRTRSGTWQFSRSLHTASSELVLQAPAPALDWAQDSTGPCGLGSEVLSCPETV